MAVRLTSHGRKGLLLAISAALAWCAAPASPAPTDTSGTSARVLSVAADMVAYVDNMEYFNRYREGYLHLGAWARPRVVYRPHERISFALGVHLRTDFGDESPFTDARPVFRASYHRNDFTFTVGELESADRHGLPDALLAEQWPWTHALEQGFQFLYRGRAVSQDFWAVYDSLNTPDHREHLMAGNATVVRLGPLAFKALVYGDHYGGQFFAPEGDPVRENLAGGIGVRFEHTRQGRLSAWGAEQTGLLSFATPDREHQNYERGGGSLSRLWLTAGGFETSLMLYKGSGFVAWKGNALYRTDDIYYSLGTKKRVDFTPHVWLDFGVRLDFVDIPPVDYLTHAENRLWVSLGGSLDRALR